MEDKFKELLKIGKSVGLSGSLKVARLNGDEKEDYFITVNTNGFERIVAYSHPDMNKCIENGIEYFKEQYEFLKSLGIVQ